MKPIINGMITTAVFFATVEFIRSNITFYNTIENRLDIAGKVGNSGSVLLLGVALLIVINTKKK